MHPGIKGELKKAQLLSNHCNFQVGSNATVGGMKIHMQKYFEKLWRTNVTFWFCALKIHILTTCTC